MTEISFTLIIPDNYNITVIPSKRFTTARSSIFVVDVCFDPQCVSFPS